ncbi:PEST proteolytic signal-containing nuclear protein [Amphibalanus amphitrite]|nr:PEST proteolytic signal-containing nuclear protein [Amphibalanus amphitrite]
MSLGPKKPAPGAVPPPKPPVKAISMKLGSKPPSSGPAPAALLKPKSLLAARAFGDGDSDDEEEEMPPEAKMRMKNIGSWSAGQQRDGPAARSVRRMTRLLRMVGATARPGRCSLVTALLLYILVTAITMQNVYILFRLGWTLLGQGQHWIRATVLSHVFGTLVAVQWASLTATFAVGRRRYAALLHQLRELAREKDLLDEHLGSRKSTFISLCMACALVFLWFSGTAATISVDRGVIDACSHSATTCALALALAFGSFIPVVGVLHLRDEVYCHIVEMVPVMLYGILILVCLIISVEFFVRLILSPSVIVFCLAITCAACVSLIGPCEASERLLSRLAAGRDLLLLLLPESRRWGEGRHQLDVMLLVAGRDLETVGDLGLFRLRRSTLLGVLSTVVTYMVIMMQFLTSAGGNGSAAFPATNATGDD